MQVPTVSQRKRVLESELKRYVDLLIAHENPERILVFGSISSGDVHRWSDIDLVIVKDTTLPFLERAREIRLLLQPKVGVDILVYTPQEFKQLQSERPFFRQEILAKSTTLYERQ